jgi:3-hydroxy-9,10-secoandrosta-1,3,5(10)-triene-9,17-dione monooxygenase
MNHPGNGAAGPQLKVHSFADVSFEDALARASAMVPALRERATRTEQACVMLPETFAELKQSGLLRYHMPKRWGGMELPFPAMIDIPVELARGCASTSWNFHNFANHSWLLAMYDPRAQEEIWGDDPDTPIAAGIAFPQGSGRKVDGGFVISGHWNFGSGVDLSPWSMFAATIRDRADGPPSGYRLCLVPRGEYEVIDDWQVMGMRGTGSKSMRIKDVFVPEYRALDMTTVRGGPDFPGARLNPGPLFRVPLVAIAGYFPATTVLGNAQAVLDLTVDRLKSRQTSYTGMRMSDFQAIQIRVAMAAAKVDTAGSIMRGDCARAWQDACAQKIPDNLAKLAYKRNAAFAVQLCTEAVDSLHALAGANGIYEQYPIERLFRDAHSAAGHFSFSFDAHGSAWGAAILGGAINNPML